MTIQSENLKTFKAAVASIAAFQHFNNAVQSADSFTLIDSGLDRFQRRSLTPEQLAAKKALLDVNGVASESKDTLNQGAITILLQKTLAKKMEEVRQPSEGQASPADAVAEGAVESPTQRRGVEAAVGGRQPRENNASAANAATPADQFVARIKKRIADAAEKGKPAVYLEAIQTMTRIIAGNEQYGRAGRKGFARINQALATVERFSDIVPTLDALQGLSRDERIARKTIITLVEGLEGQHVERPDVLKRFEPAYNAAKASIPENVPAREEQRGEGRGRWVYLVRRSCPEHGSHIGLVQPGSALAGLLDIITNDNRAAGQSR